MKLRILTEKLLVISRQFFGIPPFRFYALADGIRRVLCGNTFLPPQESPRARSSNSPSYGLPNNSGESPAKEL
jgi:hypothetical protein